jgi:hypothetical protein
VDLQEIRFGPVNGGGISWSQSDCLLLKKDPAPWRYFTSESLLLLYRIYII